MARIRSVHPGLLTDEAWMTLTVEAPIACALFIGLLTEADDGGIFEWKPLTIKARILPAPAVDVAALLDALVRNRFIMRYEAEGRSYGAIRNFMRFQRPKKPNPVHPKTEAAKAWCATGSEPLPHQSPTDGENPPQMEDGGGRMEENYSDADASGADGASEENGAAPVVDLKSQIFGAGLAWLAERTSRKPASLRGMIGRWIGKHGEEAVMHAFMAAQGARWGPSFEPVAYIEAVLAKPRETNGRHVVSASGIMKLYAEEEDDRSNGDDPGGPGFHPVPLLPGAKPH